MDQSRRESRIDLHAKPATRQRREGFEKRMNIHGMTTLLEKRQAVLMVRLIGCDGGDQN